MYRKLRKRHGFLGVQKQQCKDTKICETKMKMSAIMMDNKSSESGPCPTVTVPLSACKRKLNQHEPQH